MKKIISIILILGTILSFVGCSNSSIEQQIVSNGKQSMKNFTPLEDSFTITTVTDDSTTEYIISISQAQRTYSISTTNEISDETTLTNIQEITSSNILKTIASSKELIINYINESFIFEDKEDLISYINNLPVKLAKLPNISLVAGFDPNSDTVFINTENNLLDEHTLVHEFFHALSNRTRANSSWSEYCTTIFDEAFTELLATSVTKANYPTTYDNYIKYVYYFIGLQELDSIRAYFYGLDEVQISSSEFHLYTIAVEFLSESKTIEDIKAEELTIYLLLSKWGLEK